MREHDRRQARLPAGRALGGGAGSPPRQPAQPGVRRGQQRAGLGGLWPLLVPVGRAVSAAASPPVPMPMTITSNWST